MSFVAAPPSTAQVPAIAEDLVAGDGWWPGVSIGDFRASMRIGEMVGAVRVRDALIAALIAVDRELIGWRAAKTAAGAADLEAVEAPSFGGESRAVQLWRRAVYTTAAADLADTHNDITATDRGRLEREERATAADDHRRAATLAIRDLLGLTRSRVRLL